MAKNVSGKLKHGLEYKGVQQFAFELSGITTAGALFDAEVESGGIENQLAFNGALMAQQLVSIGDCPGPFSMLQIRGLSPGDFNILRNAQVNLDQLQSNDPNALSDSEESGS